MGQHRTIRMAAGHSPDWPAIANKLSEIGQSPVLRMIDDLPAFPNEMPDSDWKELRIGLAGGMVTLRRSGDELAVITWGDAGPILIESWNALCWAAAVVTQGTVDGQPPDQFRPA